MKTSVMEVHAMLSVLSVEEVERRIGEVPGVESVTVNFSAESATVRYDETRLAIADIKSAVRQRGYESATPVSTSGNDPHKGHAAPGAPPAVAEPTSPKAESSVPVSAGPELPRTPQPSPSKPAAAAPPVPPSDKEQDTAVPHKS